MEFGETSASATIKVEDIKEEEKKHVKIRLSVFFDGTLNNRTNTGHRIANSKVYQENKIEEGEDDNSYEGDYTNVEKIERYIETSQDNVYDKKLSIYIEGPGTEDDDEDVTKGYAFGTGKTGIEKKVAKGLVKAVSTISKHVEKTSIIDKLILDVFGFSRGAAGARNFIFEALKESDSIRQWLEEKKRPVNAIEVHFAGLFDTVASYGAIAIQRQKSNTKELKLDIIRKAKKVIHLVAADEHRKKFPLTDIKSAGDKGREIYLPGVHSDIGGGYNDEANEDMVVYNARLAKKVSAERDRLIAAGWYHADEISLKHIPPKIGMATVHLKVLRNGIRHQYSRIPLHIMARFARESDIDVRSKLERDEDIPEELEKIQQRIKAYIARIGRNSKETDWQQSDDILRQLRHDYLHFSAYYFSRWGAHSPRFGDNDQRKRMPHAG